jgi:hypothetical protein
MSFFEGVTGRAEDAFTKEFTIIPNNTTAPAMIKSVSLVEKSTQFGEQKHFEIVWKLAAGEFKGQEATQKIKCFLGDSQQIGRARNMLKLLLDLTKVTINHDQEPDVHELKLMQNKVLGIKIREWQMEKNNGSGFMEGNFVSEVHHIDDSFITQSGTKLAAKVASSANYSLPMDNYEPVGKPAHDDGCPF